jgi:hypothetical protein
MSEIEPSDCKLQQRTWYAANGTKGWKAWSDRRVDAFTLASQSSPNSYRIRNSLSLAEKFEIALSLKQWLC